jgi:hypothetical protein
LVDPKIIINTWIFNVDYSQKTGYNINKEKTEIFSLSGLLETAVAGPFSAFPTLCVLEFDRQVNPVQQTNKNRQDQNCSPHSHHPLPGGDINQ